MELETIKNIRSYRDSIRSQIKTLNLKDYEDQKFGNESEYDIKELISSIESMLTDISTLTKAPKKFIHISTKNERSTIARYLAIIDAQFIYPSDYFANFEGLKTVLRSFNLVAFSDRQIEFESELKETRDLKIQLKQDLIEVEKIKVEFDSRNNELKERINEIFNREELVEEKLEDVIEKKNNLVEQLESLDVINDDLKSIKEQAAEKLEEIKESKNESLSNEKLISSFSAKIQEKEKQIDELQSRIELNNTELDNYEKERVNILNQSKELINSAKKALNYKTAQGISASFQEQYDDAKQPWIIRSWIIGASVCLLITISIGIWIVDSASTNLSALIARISLLPLPIIGAVFCANQYTKQKHIIEDYAYKMTLSKAIVGFSEQLKKNGSGESDEYVHYIKTALSEIHKDPLRKRDILKEKKNSTSSPNLNELVEMAEKIVNMTKVQP